MAATFFRFAFVCFVAQTAFAQSTLSQSSSGEFYLPRVASGSHPQAAIALWARQQKEQMETKTSDYEATLVSRERIGGKLSDVDTIKIKVRHKPFSVYIHVLTPDHKDDEAIYVEGRNDGKLLGHTTGFTGRLVGTVALDPHGSTAMNGQRYAITEIGIAKLCGRILKYAEDDMHYDESQVHVTQGVKTDNRICTLVETIHPVERTNFHFFRQRIYIDAQWHIPVRYEQYDWPKKPDGADESAKDGSGELVEEYNYTQLKLDNGFTDADFDPHNPNYGFP